jgi:hypothetical protein
MQSPSAYASSASLVGGKPRKGKSRKGKSLKGKSRKMSKKWFF